MNSRVFLSALVLLSVALLALGDVRDDHATWYPRTGPTPTIRKSGNLPNKFDFIIIGGGTAGCVLANRLSANPSNKVLLIEAGTAQDNTQLARIPVNWDRTPFSPFDHSYLNEGREILNWNGDDRHVAAGKALGGTTVINTLMWVRGNKLDYDLWNITGWSYNDLLPFFKKVETSGRYASAPNGAFYHGNNGPVKVGPSGWQPPEDEYLITAAANWGLPFNPDWNGESQIGSGFHEHTINEGIRVTSFSAYLKPILSRSNLWVMDNSEVQKIIFKKTGGKTRADAVRFIDNINGVSYTVSAAKEVVLSAGSIRSPQLLQLSGVGPVEELNRLEIPVVKNLQGVGRNLKDHVITTMSFGTAIGQPVAGATLDAAAFAQWNATKTGVVASITARTNFFFRSDFAADARPDGQIIVTPPGTSVFSLCYLNKPRSTGEVRLFSKDPSDLPLVTGNYLTHPTDLDAIIDIMNKTYQILQQAPIHAYPFNPAYDMTSRSALELYIKGNAAFFTPANAGSGYHFTSTCKMGVSSDPTAVVDSHLRVFGISGLRVADASIFPEIPTGNTQYPTYMVGERAASFILSDNNC